MSDAFREHEGPGGGGGGAGAYYSSSSVMQFSSSRDKDGNPQVYHATSSVTKGPGGVSEVSGLCCGQCVGLLFEARKVEKLFV